MKQKVLIDTGILVAFINKREKCHSWAVQQWQRVKPPFLSCEAVITETCFLLQNIYQGEDLVMELISRKIIDISFNLDQEVNEIRSLMQSYKNVPMSLADACLVRMNELIRGSSILTLDSDFRIYRKHKKELIDLIIYDH